ncbi:MAG: hypothetical protein DMF06_14355, partial [Verrucomicrobia bacterium]
MGNSEQPAPTRPAGPQGSKKFFVCFDSPADWDKRVRWLRLSGWCVAATGEPLTAIRVRLRGRTFAGAFDRDRPDVLEHLGMPTAPRWCGFTVDLRVPPGKGDLELEVAGADGRWRKAFKRTIIGPWFSSITKQEWKHETDLADLADAPARYNWWFDRPADWDRPARTLHVSGWCVDRSGKPIESIRARIGRQEFPGNYGFERKDLAAIYGESPAFTRSGFAVAVPLQPGKSLLALECRQQGDRWRPF